MADNEHKKDSATFQDNPLEFVKAIDVEATNRVEELAPLNTENRLLYEGIDSDLEERRNDTRVIRSALFVPELTPAIDTRVSDTLATAEEREFPLTVRPKAQNPSKIQRDKAQRIERLVNEQLRNSGYLTDIWGEQILGAEIYHSPSTVKVGWEEFVEKTPVIGSAAVNSILSMFGVKPTVTFQKETKGRPYVDWLYPDEFLYEPNKSTVDTMNYLGHRMWLEPHVMLALAEDQGWDVKEVEGFLEDAQASKQDDNVQSQRDDVADEEEIPFEVKYKEGKIPVVEWYIVNYDEDGVRVIDQVVVIDNEVIVSNERDVYDGFENPFVPVVANRLPGAFEGMSSVDRGKMYQKLYNDMFNSFLDGLTYRIFPPFKTLTGMTFEKEPIYGPGQIWPMGDPDSFKPVIENPGQMPDLPSLMSAISEKLRIALNAEDSSQGFQANQYEKATATRLRSVGAQRRGLTGRKAYGQAVIDVGGKFIAMNQQFGEDSAEWVVEGGLVLDMPSLTAVSDPEEETQKNLLLISQALANPIYQNPVGLAKIRNLMEETVRGVKKTNVAQYVPTEEEFAQILQVQTEQQNAAASKQSAQEQLAIEAQTQEAQNAVPQQ